MGKMTDLSEKTGNSYTPMMLLNTKLEKGEIRQFIEDQKDPVIKDMVCAEYAYFTGNHEKVYEITKQYLEHDNGRVKASAWLMYTFANLTLCRPQEAQRGIRYIYELVQSNWITYATEEMRALFALVSNAASVLLHLQLETVPPLNAYLVYLPEGMRIWGCYILAHQAYLKGQYETGLGIVSACEALEGDQYLIPVIYLYLAGAMNAMSIGNIEKGKSYFLKAYDLAKEDELLEPFGEHHGLLQGLVETCLKKSERDYYEKIIKITYKFSYGWRRVHNPITNEDVADTLTTTEFTVAMLANRGWTNTEIADYLDININTVKRHISNIFNKLNINSRKELKPFMLR